MLPFLGIAESADAVLSLHMDAGYMSIPTHVLWDDDVKLPLLKC